MQLNALVTLLPLLAGATSVMGATMSPEAKSSATHSMTPLGGATTAPTPAGSKVTVSGTNLPSSTASGKATSTSLPSSSHVSDTHAASSTKVTGTNLPTGTATGSAAVASGSAAPTGTRISPDRDSAHRVDGWPFPFSPAKLWKLLGFGPLPTAEEAAKEGKQESVDGPFPADNEGPLGPNDAYYCAHHECPPPKSRPGDLYGGKHWGMGDDRGGRHGGKTWGMHGGDHDGGAGDGKKPWGGAKGMDRETAHMSATISGQIVASTPLVDVHSAGSATGATATLQVEKGHAAPTDSGKPGDAPKHNGMGAGGGLGGIFSWMPGMGGSQPDAADK